LSQQLEQGPMLARSSSASDSATLSAYGVAIDCLVALSKRRALIERPIQENDFYYEEKIQQCVNTLGAILNEHPANHTTVVRAINHHRLGSTNFIQYGGAGQVRVEVHRKKLDGNVTDANDVSIVLSLTLVAGFQLSAQADEDERVPLQVTLSDDETHWDIESLNLPSSAKDETSSQLAVYQESVELEVKMKRREGDPDLLSNSIGLNLQLQLCNEQLCLPAEILGFRV